MNSVSMKTRPGPCPAVDGGTPADWDYDCAEDLVVPDVGEDLTLKACADSSGSVSAS